MTAHRRVDHLWSGQTRDIVSPGPLQKESCTGDEDGKTQEVQG